MSRKKDGRRFEVELDWYYVSKETLWRWALVVLGAAVLVSAGIYFWLNRGEDVEGRARREIAAADELLAKGRIAPGAARAREEIVAAAEKLEGARASFAAARYPEALQQAVEARQLALRITAGTGAVRHDAAIMELGGRVEIQRASRANWETARVGMKLYEGDFLKTGANGLAEVMAVDGTFYRIKAETLFEVHRSRVLPGGGQGAPQRQSEIKFIVGTVDVDTGEGSRSIVRTDAATADIASRSAVGVDVDASKTTGVSAYRGRVTLSTESGSVTLRDRERVVARVGAGGLGPKTVLPDPPRPLSPDDTAVFDLNRRQPVTLKWSPAKKDARYRLQIARSRLFIPDSILIVDDRPKPEAVVTVTEEGAFYWRVATLGEGNVTSEWSPIRRFKVLAGGGRASGPDTVPPELSLSRPQVNGTLVILSGRSEPGSAVFVNGEPADVDASGVFRKVISFEREGVNVLTVRAVDGAGNETLRRETVMIEVY
ncbi:MAG TPA: hypothetical protein P5164_06935 [Thermoanaerobaculia bacterium]|nr:hypothetical protein [Thermoanaerobaculia bacterium]